MSDDLKGTARLLRDLFAHSSGTGLHIHAAEQLEEAADRIAALKEQLALCSSAFNAQAEQIAKMIKQRDEDAERIAALEAAIDDIDLIANAVRSEYDGSPADIALAVHVAIKGRLTDTGENRE